MNTWRILSDKAHYWKGHFVSVDLLPELEGNLVDRAIEKGPYKDGPAAPIFEVSTPSGEDGFFIDLPGMVSMHRRIREVVVDGLRVAVPSQDWATILAEVKLSRERVFTGGEKYYKLHGRFWCLVLTPRQRDLLLAGMEMQEADAVREGREDDDALVAAINEANESMGRKGVISWRAEQIANAKKNDAN